MYHHIRETITFIKDHFWAQGIRESRGSGRSRLGWIHDKQNSSFESSWIPAGGRYPLVYTEILERLAQAMWRGHSHGRSDHISYPYPLPPLVVTDYNRKDRRRRHSPREPWNPPISPCEPVCWLDEMRGCPRQEPESGLDNSHMASYRIHSTKRKNNPFYNKTTEVVCFCSTNGEKSTQTHTHKPASPWNLKI